MPNIEETPDAAPPRRRRRVRTLFSLVIVMAAVSTALVASGVSPASAATCRTPGMAYLTQPGAVYFSGYDGDQRFGVPRITAVSSFSGNFRFGGNGIAPGTRITFRAEDLYTLTPVDILPGTLTLTTPAAGSNCVVNEIGPYEVAASTGLYRITATYTSGNKGVGVIDQVVDIMVF
jgi:hypothetical protein